MTDAADHNRARAGCRSTVRAVYVEISLTTVPPTVELKEPEDFKAFKVVVREAEHAWVSPERVAELAADAGASQTWGAEFAAMVDFARSKGWVRDDGAIRAHVEQAS